MNESRKKTGEFDLIERIKTLFEDIQTDGCEGIGDDCAVIPWADGESMVVTTDLLVEGVHFLRHATSPHLLGRKSLAVNLSDVAAMGAAPVASFLSLSLPEGARGAWVDEFMAGYKSLSAEFGVPLLGGDTTASLEKITISVTALGRVANGHIKRRSGASVGDKLFVTGILGDSSKGLHEILAGDSQTPFVAQHNNPKPYVKEGKWLGAQSGVHAMMDLSDGLASDLVHVLKASNVGAEILLEMIPHNSTVELAVTGGEDYKLLLAADPVSAPNLQRAYAEQFGEPLYEIGTLTPSPARITWLDRGHAITPPWQGFTHF